MRTITWLIVTIFASTCPLLAADITAVGGWTETIDASDLIAGAGSDLQSDYYSATNATTLDVTAIGNYKVDVRRSDTNWSGDFTLYLKRTSDGTGSGTISGGTSYITVSLTDTEFFTGSLDRSGIDVQYHLAGMSVNISPDTYSTTITFTITDQ